MAYDTTGVGENVTVVGVDLTVAKTHSGSFAAGIDGVYSIVAHNAGTVPSSGLVTVTDTLPTGLAFVSGTGTNWACAAVGSIVSCTGSDPIAAGSDAVLITFINVSREIDGIGPAAHRACSDEIGGEPLNAAHPG